MNTIVIKYCFRFPDNSSEEFKLELNPLNLELTGTPEMIAQAKASGKRWKLVCSAEKVEGSVGGRRQTGAGSTVISVVWYGVTRPLA